MAVPYPPLRFSGALPPSLDERSGEVTGLTEGHSRRVTEFALRLADVLGLDAHSRLMLAWGAQTHDLGKARVPAEVLLKPGPLTPEERALVERHPAWGAEMLADAPEPVREVALTHHERWDGAGYPLGLRGEEIPLLARVVAVCDVYDALTSDRPYRARWSHADAAQHLRAHAGAHFDPLLVELFLTEVLGES